VVDGWGDGWGDGGGDGVESRWSPRGESPGPVRRGRPWSRLEAPEKEVGHVGAMLQVVLQVVLPVRLPHVVT
jgi:hypothetical protein